MVVVSGTFSFEQLDQIRKRIDRPGQTKPLFYYYLVAEGTVDEVLQDVVEGKATNQAGVLAAIQEYVDARTNPDN